MRNAYSFRLVNKDWYVVDLSNGDLIKRCRSKIDAEQEAELYNLEIYSGQLVQLAGIGL